MNQDEMRKAEVERRRMIYNSQHNASEVSKVPDTAHFAVLCNDSLYYTDSYNDSATHHYVSYIFFDNEEALSAWIIENSQKKTFVVVHVRPVEYELKTSITLKE